MIRTFLRRRPACHRVLSGPLRGMRIHTSWHDYPQAILGRAEARLCRWIGDHARLNETWIDVGAHHGITALALCKSVGPRGRVFAFEPVLASAGLLAKTREVNGLRQLTVVPLALGDADELSLLRVSSQSHGMIGIIPEMRAREWTGEGEMIYEVAFDRIWPRLCEGRADVHGVKIDVQGAEAHVLLGMRDTLTIFKPRLVVEYHGYADLGEFLDALDAVGYSPIGRDIDCPSAGATSQLLHGHNYEFAALDGSSETIDH